MKKMRGMKWGILAVAGMLLPGGVAKAAVLSTYDASVQVGGSFSPVDQGWTLSGGTVVVPSPGSETIGGVTYDYWNIGASTSSVNINNYRVTYPNNTPFSSIDGWTATSVVRVLSASKNVVRDSYFEVRDGSSIWGIGLFRQTTGGFSDQGIALINSSGSYTVLGNLNVSSDYITLQLYYNPNGAGTADDTLQVFVNGTQVGSNILRSQVETTANLWTRWGDNTASTTNDARSQTHWNTVSFETGYAVVPEPGVAVLLGAGGVFLMLANRRRMKSAA